MVAIVNIREPSPSTLETLTRTNGRVKDTSLMMAIRHDVAVEMARPMVPSTVRALGFSKSEPADHPSKSTVPYSR